MFRGSVATDHRGETIGRFTIVRQLYRRDVFQARDGRHHVALELLRGDRERLRTAVAAASKLEHPNLCRVRELIETPEACAIVMDLADGATLADRLLLGPLDATKVTSLIGQLLDALAAVHAAGLVHGSVTADTAMIGNDGKLVLLDLGIREGTVAGDLERTGALAYALLTADTTGEVKPGAAGPLARWIERCLAGDFPDAKAAAAGLAAPDAAPARRETQKIDRPIVASPDERAPVATPTAEPRRRTRLYAGLAAAVVVMAAGIWIAATTGGKTIYEPAPAPRVASALEPGPDRPINKYGRPPLPSGAIEPSEAPAAFSLATPPARPAPLVAAPPTPIPAPTPAPAARPVVGTTIGEVPFSAESTWIETPAIAILDQVYKQLVQNPTLRIQVAGHSSADGGDIKNRAKSYARALSVRNYFTANGIPATRIDVVARGAADPKGDNDTADGRARNRRVEIRALP